MKAVVVYESLWGNTAAIARAIAEGIGKEARCLSTLEATPAAVKDAELLVVGAPVMGFRMPNAKTLASVTPAGSHPADLSHPPMREWLDGLYPAQAKCAAFDTRVRGPFGNAAKAIAKALEAKGCESVAKPTGFIVTGKYGPLRDGEVEKARKWGVELARAAQG